MRAQCITGGTGRDHELVPIAATLSTMHTTTTPLKPPTTTDFSTGRRHCVTMTRSWISNGSVRPRGPTSKTCEAPLTFSRQHDSGLPCSKHNMPSCEPSCTRGPLPSHQSQHRRCYSSAVGSSWDDQPRKFLMPTTPASWKHDWTFSGLKTGLLSGLWYVPSATFPPLLKHAGGQRPNKPKPESARLPRLLDRVRKVELWRQRETPRQSLSPETSSRKSRASTRSTPPI